MKLVNNDVHLITKTMLSCEWGINKNVQIFWSLVLLLYIQNEDFKYEVQHNWNT